MLRRPNAQHCNKGLYSCWHAQCLIMIVHKGALHVKATVMQIKHGAHMAGSLRAAAKSPARVAGAAPGVLQIARNHFTPAV